MVRLGFDNEKYLVMQSERIKERIAQFGGKLYLEFGGKADSAENHAQSGGKYAEIFHLLHDLFSPNLKKSFCCAPSGFMLSCLINHLAK